MEQRGQSVRPGRLVGRGQQVPQALPARKDQQDLAVTALPILPSL